MNPVTENMVIVAVLSVIVLFYTTWVTLPMVWGDHYLMIFIIIRLNASLMWTLSVLVIVFGEEILG